MEILKGGKEYFNKRYIKDHPYSLFIYEDTLHELEFEDYSNVFPIPTYDNEGDYFRDKHLEKNKKVIRDSIEDVKKTLKRRRFKKIILPETTIGKGKSRLNEKAPKTYEYIKRKVRELVDDIENMDSGRITYNKYNTYKRYSRHRNRGYKYHYPRSHKSRNRRYDSNSSSINSRNTRKIRRKIKERMRRKYGKSKKKKGKKYTRINSVGQASDKAQKKCNDCIKFKNLLDKEPTQEDSKKGRKFIKELQNAEKKCIQCNKLCKYMDKNMKPSMKDYDIYEARYPSICLNDEQGNKRVDRLMNSYRKKLVEQYENFDLNFKN